MVEIAGRIEEGVGNDLDGGATIDTQIDIAEILKKDLVDRRRSKLMCLSCPLRGMKIN